MGVRGSQGGLLVGGVGRGLEGRQREKKLAFDRNHYWYGVEESAAWYYQNKDRHSQHTAQHPEMPLFRQYSISARPTLQYQLQPGM